MSKIDDLTAEIDALQRRLKEAEAELLNERFADVPRRFAVGDVVLVPRMLFGKCKWWPAQVVGVHLRHNSGTYKTGEDWETKVVSYSVYYEDKDGNYTGSSHGFYDNQIEPQVVPS